MADETILNKKAEYETDLNETTNGNAPTTLNLSVGEYDDNSTLLNNTAGRGLSRETVLNSSLLDGGVLSENQMVEDYRILERMQVETGEADLYICEKNSKKYVLKHYRREAAIKEEIIKKLKAIDSPYVAKLVSTGIYHNRPYEIIPYYINGSLQGKRYSLEELKTTIIPELNEALHELHSHEIVHKDLKPSNIMLSDNGTDIAVIDFGISSVKENGNTIVLTKTGFTPDYTAHEAFNGLYLNESDYYSLGITVYELYTGTTPYRDLTSEQIELYTSVQKIPLPDDMDKELKELISALTYYDITNRKDKSNPNRRWTYEEVKKWLAGERQVIPGTGTTEQNEYKDEGQMQGYLFMGTVYSDRHRLALAFAHNWEKAKKELFNGMLSARFKASDQAFAIACMDAEEAYGTGINSDLLFFRILYRLDENLEDFIWKGHQYNNLEALGKEIQDKLWHSTNPNMSLFSEILRYKIISEYLLTIPKIPEEVKASIDAIETNYSQLTHNSYQRKMEFYLLGYLLSGRKVFFKNERMFETVEELITYLQEMLRTSYHKFEVFCEELIDEDGRLDPQLESWLISLGKNDQIEKWKKRFGR